MSKTSRFDATTDPFFCTQLFFVPPEPDQLQNPTDISQNPELALKQNLVWKSGTVLRVRFLDGIQSVQDTVIEYASQWTEHANISFKVVSSGDADIRITFNQGMVFSYVGTASREVSQEKRTMNLQLDIFSHEENFSRAVLHGFGLALGFKHVHQVTPSGIPWDLQALYSYYARNAKWSQAQVQLNVLNILKADTLSSPDGESIMLYSIPGSLTTNEINIQGQGALTATDIALASSLYPRGNDLNASLVQTTHSGPWERVPEGGVYPLKQSISPAASAVPKVSIGLACVYTIGDKHIRVNSKVDAVTTSNIDVTIATKDKSRLLAGVLSTLWVTPKFPYPVFQTGSYWSEHGQAINHRINFEIPYKTRPKVFVGLSAIDLGDSYDLDVTVVSADREGFYVNITSPGGLQTATISWVAWPGNHPGVETGTFYTGRVEGGKEYTIKGTSEFDTVFDRPPKVHFALSSFSFQPNYEFEILLNTVASKTSLTWSATSWVPMGRVRGNYLVFQV